MATTKIYSKLFRKDSNIPGNITKREETQLYTAKTQYKSTSSVKENIIQIS